MKTLVLAISLLLAAPPDDMLTGRWESPPSEKGNRTGLLFKDGYILEGYINKKPFASGRYFFNASDSVLAIVDNGCNGLTAVYKVEFFSNSDSMRVAVIMDSCTERRKGIQRLVFGRKK